MAVLSPSLKKTHVLNKGVAGPSDQKPLYTGPIDTTWPSRSTVGRGFNNTGNTCFLNSALQCLLHTAPLARILIQHQKETCASASILYPFLHLRFNAVRPGQDQFLYDMCDETDDGRYSDEICLHRPIPHHHKIASYVAIYSFLRRGLKLALCAEIAKHMRRGRQEDSHEFLRYAIDALQRSCLHGYPPCVRSVLSEGVDN